MFERFTERARRVVVLAQEESRGLDHDYIGTEHLLLGLLREQEGLGAKVLEGLGISLDDARKDVEEMVGRGEPPPRRSGKRWRRHVPFTPRSKKVLELALREGIALGHNYIGTEHLLLGLVREGEGVANQVLQKRGATVDRIREEVSRQLGVAEAAERSVEADEPMGIREAISSSQVETNVPRCPTCRTDLTEAGAVGAHEVEVTEGAGSLRMAFCRRCGTALGILGS